MQTKNQAKKAPTMAANVKNKPAKQKYTFINVRVKPETKSEMTKLAKHREMSLSRAVEQLIEEELAQNMRPRMWIGTSSIDPTITLTPEEIQAYEKPQLISAGKPVAREPWFVRLFNRLFGR